MLADAMTAAVQAALTASILAPLVSAALAGLAVAAYLRCRRAPAREEESGLAGQVMAANVREALAAERAAAADQRLERVFAAAPVGMALLDGRGCIIRANPALKRILDLPSLVGVQLAEAVEPDERQKVGQLVSDATEASGVELQIGGSGQDGGWGRLSITPLGGEGGDLLVQIEDASDRRRAEERLEHLATHDPVTGLPNRLLFHSRAAAALRQANRTGCYVGCLVVGLDHFRAVNDSLGHAAGDRLLTTMATRLAQAVRPGDTVARVGDDEFCLLLVGLEHQAEAALVARRVRRAVDGFLELDGLQVATSASVGVAVARPGTRTTSETLVREADIALCRAQADGLSRTVVFDAGLRDDVLRRLATGA